GFGQALVEALQDVATVAGGRRRRGEGGHARGQQRQGEQARSRVHARKSSFQRRRVAKTATADSSACPARRSAAARTAGSSQRRNGLQARSEARVAGRVGCPLAR